MRQRLALLKCLIIKQYIQYTCFWFLIFDNYLYFGLYLYTEIHFLLHINVFFFLKEYPIMFLNKIVISTRHVYTYKCGGGPATYHEVI